MNRDGAIALCKYYKGEAENPFAPESKPGLFWFLEKICCEQCEDNALFWEGWMQEVDSYLKRNPTKNNDLTNPDKYTKEQKAIILYLDAMIDKWTPEKRDWIFDY